MLRCARSTAGSARTPPSRKPPPWGPRGKGTVPAGKSARSNALPLGGTEGGEHSFRSLFCPRTAGLLRICWLPRRIRPPFYGAPDLGQLTGDACHFSPRKGQSQSPAVDGRAEDAENGPPVLTSELIRVGLFVGA